MTGINNIYSMWGEDRGGCHIARSKDQKYIKKLENEILRCNSLEYLGRIKEQINRKRENVQSI